MVEGAEGHLVGMAIGRVEVAVGVDQGVAGVEVVAHDGHDYDYYCPYNDDFTYLPHCSTNRDDQPVACQNGKDNLEDHEALGGEDLLQHILALLISCPLLLLLK